MSSSTGPSLAHRTVSSIRTGSGSHAGKEISPGPHTPIRSISSNFGSPSNLRAEEDAIVIELGCRKLRVGFAGDAVPRRIVAFDSELTKRAGDFRAWDAGYNDGWRKRGSGEAWGREQQFWQLDVRGQDLALVGDKMERGLRDAFTKHLLIDSKPRKMSLVLPPAMPIPLLSTILNTLFDRFQAPLISLLSSPVMTAFSGGVRSGLVVDIGWHETVVTGVYEYREVQTWRTVRAGKMLLDETRNFLVEAVEGRIAPEGSDREQKPNDVIRFEECEEVATRMLWCRKAHKTPGQGIDEGLPTLHEQDESESIDPAEDPTPIPITLNSCRPPTTIQIPFSKLAEPCETTFFQTRLSPACFDDHELPLQLLVYRGLLQLPMDVRALCMSRIIFTGGCSNIPGLKGRIFDEVSLLAEERGWDPIQGKSVEGYKRNPKLRRNGSQQVNDGSIPVIQAPIDTSTSVGDVAPSIHPAHVPPQKDQVEEFIQRDKGYKPPVQGSLRAIDSLGPWCGASLASQLKIPALAMVDKDLWSLHGTNGASKPNEIDIQAQQKQQRQSMGPGLARNSQMSNWTLGVFGPL